MREKLRKIPKALKKQILLRYLSGVLIFILYDILIADSRNIYIYFASGYNNFSISDYKRQYFVV